VIAPPPPARQEAALAGPNPRGRRAAPAASGDKKLYPCFRFQRGECKNGAGCEYAHRKMTPDEEKRYNQRDRSPSRGGSPRGSPGGEGAAVGPSSRVAFGRPRAVAPTGTVAGSRTSATLPPHLVPPRWRGGSKGRRKGVQGAKVSDDGSDGSSSGVSTHLTGRGQPCRCGAGCDPSPILSLPSLSVRSVSPRHVSWLDKAETILFEVDTPMRERRRRGRANPVRVDHVLPHEDAPTLSVAPFEQKAYCQGIGVCVR
jgi:hypothetical protein